MPYGPPDTMKYVAATSGSNRILRPAGLSAGDIDVNVTKSQGQLRLASANMMAARAGTWSMECAFVLGRWPAVYEGRRPGRLRWLVQ